MGFDWKMFAADFLTEVTEDIEERQDEAKEYLKEQKAAAERSTPLAQQRMGKAQLAISYGEKARQLGASNAQIATAMASGMTGVADLYNKLQKVANSKGVKRLGVDDIEAVVNMPNIPGVNEMLADTSLETFAKRTYGAIPTTTTKPDQKEYGMLASMFGYDAKQRAEQKLADTPYMDGMSIADINALTRQAEFQQLIPGATMTFNEIDYFTPKEALSFSSSLSKAMSDASTGKAADAYVAQETIGLFGDDKKAKEARARKHLKYQAADTLIEFYAQTYEKGGFFENNLVLKQIEAAVGRTRLNDLLQQYGVEVESDDEDDNEAKGEGNKKPKEPVVKSNQTLRKDPKVIDPEAEPEDPTLKAAPPLDEQGKAIIEQALSGQLIKGYTAEYTREQWDNMSRKEREERDLPVSRAGIIGFDFREDVDKMLEKPLRNLNIKRNLENKEYKIKIKGKGTFTATKEQIESMDDSAFTNVKPAIEIYEYEQGEKKARKLTTRILERYQLNGE